MDDLKLVNNKDATFVPYRIKDLTICFSNGTEEPVVFRADNRGYPPATLSLGERMKMELLAALLHNPKILFLDEPTIGLDAVASMQIRRYLKEVNQDRKTTILLTSHYMEDIKSLCRRSVVISQGMKVYDGSTEQLFERYQNSKRITLVFEELTKIEIPETLAEKCRILEDNGYKKVYEMPKEDSGRFLEYFMSYKPTDISLDEEEIGRVVERIYADVRERT